MGGDLQGSSELSVKCARVCVFLLCCQGRAGSGQNKRGPQEDYPALHRQHQARNVRGGALRELRPRLQLGAVVHVHQPAQTVVGRRGHIGSHQVNDFRVQVCVLRRCN